MAGRWPPRALQTCVVSMRHLCFWEMLPFYREIPEGWLFPSLLVTMVTDQPGMSPQLADKMSPQAQGWSHFRERVWLGAWRAGAGKTAAQHPPHVWWYLRAADWGSPDP